MNQNNLWGFLANEMDHEKVWESLAYINCNICILQILE